MKPGKKLIYFSSDADGNGINDWDEIEGCMNQFAFNYDENATINCEEDGCCEPVILGCIDPEAFNYNSNSNTDDGSCIEIILGCTDESAYNFNYDQI